MVERLRDLHPTLRSCLSDYEERLECLEQDSAEIQAECPHDMVAEIAYEAKYNSAARRICLHCRIEEQGSHWSGGPTWSRRNHEVGPVLGNKEGRDIIPVGESEDFYSLRLPVGEAHCDAEPDCD